MALPVEQLEQPTHNPQQKLFPVVSCAELVPFVPPTRAELDGPGDRRGGSEQAEKVVRVSGAIGMASFSCGTSVGAGSILRCVRHNVSNTWLSTKRSSARNLFGEADIFDF